MTTPLVHETLAKGHPMKMNDFDVTSGVNVWIVERDVKSNTEL